MTWPKAGSRCPRCCFYVPAADGSSYCDLPECPLPKAPNGSLCGWQTHPDAAWPKEPLQMLAQTVTDEMKELTEQLSALAERVSTVNVKLQILAEFTDSKGAKS